jgi:hypothetical protein
MFSIILNANTTIEHMLVEQTEMNAAKYEALIWVLKEIRDLSVVTATTVRVCSHEDERRATLQNVVNCL